MEDNLGITRKTIRNYEAKGLLSPTDNRNPSNNYREYDEDDVEKIWKIKILQEIGFSLSELCELRENPNVDEYELLSVKISELEKKREEITKYIEFAQTIKATGLFPDVKKVGSTDYKSFMNSARESWNIYRDPQIASVYEMLDCLADIKDENISDDMLEKLQKFIDSAIQSKQIQLDSSWKTYCKIISEMKSFDYRSDKVQFIVNLFYKFIKEDLIEEKDVEKFTPSFFAQKTAIQFIDGSDIGKINIQTYGMDNSEFIANAIAYFGGFDSWKNIN